MITLLLFQCSASCMEGVRTRHVQCAMSRSLEPLSDIHCADKAKPAEQEVCVVHSTCPSWNTSQWSYVRYICICYLNQPMKSLMHNDMPVFIMKS